MSAPDANPDIPTLRDHQRRAILRPAGAGTGLALVSLERIADDTRWPADAAGGALPARRGRATPPRTCHGLPGTRKTTA